MPVKKKNLTSSKRSSSTASSKIMGKSKASSKRNLIIGVVVAVTLAISGYFIVTSQAASTGSIIAFNGTLIDGRTRACIDLDRNNTGNRTPIQTWYCNGHSAQQWSLMNSGSGYSANNFWIKKAGTSKCLDISGGARHAGAKIQLWPCIKGGSAQQWRLISQGRGDRVAFYNPASGKCLDVSGGRRTPMPVRLQIWHCNKELPQAFRSVAGSYRN